MDGVKYRLPGPTFRVSNSVGLEQGPRICVFNKFPGNDDDDGLGATLRTTALDNFCVWTL